MSLTSCGLTSSISPPLSSPEIRTRRRTGIVLYSLEENILRTPLDVGRLVPSHGHYSTQNTRTLHCAATNPHPLEENRSFPSCGLTGSSHSHLAAWISRTLRCAGSDPSRLEESIRLVPPASGSPLLYSRVFSYPTAGATTCSCSFRASLSTRSCNISSLSFLMRIVWLDHVAPVPGPCFA